MIFQNCPTRFASHTSHSFTKIVNDSKLKPKTIDHRVCVVLTEINQNAIITSYEI